MSKKSMKFSLNTQMLMGAVVGILGGLFVNVSMPAENPTRQFFLYGADIIGGIFVDLLKMILIPLVFTSIAVGIGNLGRHAHMGRVLKVTVIYFLSTPAIAVLLGLLLVNIVQPGRGLEMPLFQTDISTPLAAQMTLSQFFKSFLSNLFMNPFKAMAENQVLPTVLFAMMLGVGLVVMRERSSGLQKLLNEFFDLIMIIVGWIMRIAPFGIMALLFKLVAVQKVAIFATLGKFIGVVIIGTLFHGLVILPAILYFFTRQSPLTFFRGMKDALITAFSTSSSSATLPVTIRCTTENLHVNKDIVGFVAPLGATLNMDGTALYEAVAAIFVANLAGIDLNLIQQGIVFFTAILASIGAPGIPSAGMVTMIMVLQSVGLPIEAIAILLPIDRPLDAIRTTVNVQGDAVCSLIVQRAIGKNSPN